MARYGIQFNSGKETEMTKKIVVVGAGPAGMTAALRAAELGSEVFLLEKNDAPGRKFLMTGCGRCNITSSAGFDDFLAAFGRNGAFLRDAFNAFFREDLLGVFEKKGVRFREEEENKIFPAGDAGAKELLSVLEKALSLRGVRVSYLSKIKEIILSEGRAASCRAASGESISCDSLVIATGGRSYPSTGSDGYGIEMASKCGHRVVTPCPALVPLIVEEPVGLIEGVSLRDVHIDYMAGNKKAVSGSGDIVFTRSGISGPAALLPSGVISRKIMEGEAVTAVVDIFPAKSRGAAEMELDGLIFANRLRNIGNIIGEHVPGRLASYILSSLGIDASKRGADLRKEETRGIKETLKGMKFRIKGTEGFEKAMVTSGGVSLKDIDPKTMGSRVVKGLYFAGEVMDIDGRTGGFNLQAAFSSGYLAGESASRN
jgi:predicted Rossmann fold flavoprotein